MAPGWNEGAVFTQSQIDCMRVGLTRACKALAFAFPSGTVDQATQELLAYAILEAAAEGENSPLRLSAVALRNLPPLESVNARDLTSGEAPHFVSAPTQAELPSVPYPERLGKLLALVTA